jgi:hypothetical protein
VDGVAPAIRSTGLMNPCHMRSLHRVRAFQTREIDLA